MVGLPAPQAAEDLPVLDELTPREIVRGANATSSARPMPSAPSLSPSATVSAACSWSPKSPMRSCPRTSLDDRLPPGRRQNRVRPPPRQAWPIRQAPLCRGQQADRGQQCLPRRRIHRSAIWSKSPSTRGAKSVLNGVGERARSATPRSVFSTSSCPRSPSLPRAMTAPAKNSGERLRAGKLDDRMVEIDVKERGPTFEVNTAAGAWRRWISIPKRDMLWRAVRRFLERENGKCESAKPSTT